MSVLAAAVAYVLITLGIVACINGSTETGAGLIGVGCLVALSTRLDRR